MKKWIFILSIVWLTGLYACNNDAKLNGIITVDSRFDTDTSGWTGGFAGHSALIKDTFDIEFSRAHMPAPLDTTKFGLRMLSDNADNEMFMFLKKRITGLKSNTDYHITFDVNMVTQYPDAAEVVGSPGSTVYLKAGASANEPIVKVENTIYKINIDKGTEATGGTQMVTLGNVANGANTFVYRMISRSGSDNPLIVRTNDQGQLWLCVGTDTKYEGLTILYYDQIKATLNLVE